MTSAAPVTLRRPPLVRVLNALGGGLGALGLDLPRLEAERLLRAAERETGFSDYGSDSFHPALEALLYSLNEEAGLNQMGRIIFRGMILDALVGRLSVVAWEKTHRDLAAAPVEAPLIIMGMPRTGTSILFEMLAADPRARAPLTWECRDYRHAHRLAGDPLDDPHIRALGKRMAQMDRLMPGFSAIHYFDPFTPTECLQLTLLDLCSDQFPTLAWMPTYRAFLLGSDYRSAYAWHKRALRYFQATQPDKAWVLKTPVHAGYLPALLETYPDAQLIHTHRDPMTVIASTASLCAVGRSGWSDISTDHVAERADQDARYVAELTGRATAYRWAHPDRADRFIDISFRRFLDDPMGQIDAIYAHFGRDLQAHHRAPIAAYLQNRPRHKYGKHSYSLEQFGLNPADYIPLFKSYTERFGDYL